MKYKNGLRTFPRLVVDRSEILSEGLAGFLQVGTAQKRIEVGTVDSREFRLVQCLFSPRNFLSAKYEPVAQTHERVFGAIRTGADALNARLANHTSAESEMTAIVERSLRNLQKGKVGDHFAFVSKEGRVRMEVASHSKALSTK